MENVTSGEKKKTYFLVSSEYCLNLLISVVFFFSHHINALAVIFVNW